MPAARSARLSLSGSTLKIIAVVTMLIDHFGACVLERGFLRMQAIADQPGLWQSLYRLDRILRTIGRISFPIFCFLLVEGFLHTRDRKRYAFRLFLFALISEIPFDLAIRGTFSDMAYQNVFFTLLIGLVMMIFCDLVSQRFAGYMQAAAHALVIGVAMLLAFLLHTDYSWHGILSIAALYLFRRDKRMQTIAGAATFYWESAAMLAFLPILFYNGKRGLPLRYIFYWFYPAHLALLWALTAYVLLCLS